MRPSTRRAGATAALALAIGLVLGAATVVAQTSVVRGRGSQINQVRTAAGGPFEFSGSNEDAANITGARHRIVLTAPSTLVVARFSATTLATGGPGRFHAFVDVRDNDNGDALVMTMNGVSHMDSTDVDPHEAHAVEQSATLPPGDYDFAVRIQIFGLGDGDPVDVSIPMWHFTVERIV